MRSPIVLAIALVAGAACSSGSTAASVDSSFARDLQLASIATLALTPSPGALSSLETMPLSAPAPALRPRAAQTGARRVASPRATAASAVTATPQDDAEVGATVELAGGAAGEAVPAFETAEGGVALPRPVPVSVGLPPVDVGADDGYSRGGRGSVIRGGEIDDCRIHDGRSRRPVYRPPARTGGVGGGRWGDRAGRAGTSDRPSGGPWGDASRRPETPRTGGAEGRRAGSGERSGGVWRTSARGRQ